MLQISIKTQFLLPFNFTFYICHSPIFAISASLAYYTKYPRSIVQKYILPIKEFLFFFYFVFSIIIYLILLHYYISISYFHYNFLSIHPLIFYTKKPFNSKTFHSSKTKFPIFLWTTNFLLFSPMSWSLFTCFTASFQFPFYFSNSDRVLLHLSFRRFLASFIYHFLYTFLKSKASMKNHRLYKLKYLHTAL